MKIILLRLLALCAGLALSQDIRVGAYSTVTNPSDQGVVQASNYLRSRHQELTNATVFRADMQIVSGVNYRIWFRDARGTEYQGSVYVTLGGVMTEGNFVVSLNQTSNSNPQQNQTQTQSQSQALPNQNNSSQNNTSSFPPDNPSNSNSSQPAALPPLPTLPPL